MVNIYVSNLVLKQINNRKISIVNIEISIRDVNKRKPFPTPDMEKKRQNERR